ncbi:MAG: ATP-binding protein [Candidatus Micrarchaeia archaeon]
MPNIKEEMINLNPWWKGEFKLSFKERDVYRKIQKFIPLPQIIALTGLRRVGKTTILFKLAEDAINQGLDPKNILYFSFDEFKAIEIKKIVSEYEELFGKNLRNGKFLFLFDEIQKLDDWENQLKAFYDVYGKNAKIIISGSESLFIKKKSKETLAGRLFEFKVEPLSFKEFLNFKQLKFEPVELYERELKEQFKEFTLTYGFPELVGIKDKEIIKKYVVESIVEKVIYKDIPSLMKVKDISIIASLLNTIMEEPGQLAEVSEFANNLKISRYTTASYLRYLEDSFLIRKLYNFSRSRRKVERKLKKYYPTIISPSLLFRDDELSQSKVFEWMIVNQLRAEFFWRDAYKNEVDIILLNEQPTPIEVKYGKIEFEGISTFMEKFNVKRGYIVSLDTEEKKNIGDKAVDVIPAFKFLLRQSTEI